MGFIIYVIVLIVNTHDYVFIVFYLNSLFLILYLYDFHGFLYLLFSIVGYFLPILLTLVILFVIFILLSKNGEIFMNKQKISIALGGAIVMLSSMFAPEVVLAYGLVGLGATLVALSLVPLLSFFVNPIIEKILSTSFGRSIGERGRYMFRLFFSVPTFKLKRKKVSID